MRSCSSQHESRHSHVHVPKAASKPQAGCQVPGAVLLALKARTFVSDFAVCGATLPAQCWHGFQAL